MSQKILLVDDAPDMRFLMRCLLQPAGYEILEASNGHEALAILDSASVPNLIFLDHVMPEMDGPEFLKAFEEKYAKIFSDIPVILFTGSDPKEIPVTHATEVVFKPVKLESILQLVEKHLH